MGAYIQLSDFLCSAESNSLYAERLKKQGYGPFSSHTLRLTRSVTGASHSKFATAFVEKHRKTGVIRVTFEKNLKTELSEMLMKTLTKKNFERNIELEKSLYHLYSRISEKDPDLIPVLDSAVYKISEIAVSPIILSLNPREAVSKATSVASRLRETLRIVRNLLKGRNAQFNVWLDLTILPVIGPVWDEMSLEITSNIISELGLPPTLFSTIYKLVSKFAISKETSKFIEEKTKFNQDEVYVLEERIRRLGSEISIEDLKKIEKAAKRNSIDIGKGLQKMTEKQSLTFSDVMNSFENLFEIIAFPPGELLGLISDELTQQYKFISKIQKKDSVSEQEIIILRNLNLAGKKYIADAKGALDGVRAIIIGVFEPIMMAKSFMEATKIWPDEELCENWKPSDIANHAALILVENNNFYRFGLQGQAVLQRNQYNQLFKEIDEKIESSSSILTLVFGDIDTSSEEDTEGLFSSVLEIIENIKKAGLSVKSFGPLTFAVIADNRDYGARKIAQVLDALIPLDETPVPGIGLASAPYGAGFISKEYPEGVLVAVGETIKRSMILSRLSWSVKRVLCDLSSALSLIKYCEEFKIFPYKSASFIQPEDPREILAEILYRRTEPHDIVMSSPPLHLQFFGALNKTRQLISTEDYGGELATLTGANIESPVFSITKKNVV
ncbi:hypothetical protein JXA84_01085 [candidate division WOR-3 bacterium]|nr:hypothetical protein [candidate division WOR-3 bacterium]